MAKAPKNFAQVARGYNNLWKKVELKKDEEAFEIADRIIAVLDRYAPITDKIGVPEWAIGILHYRESNLNFNTYLGNGQPLNRRTTIVPKDRGPFDSFEEGAIDALKLQGLDRIKDWSAARFLYESERYNGFGYFMRGINSPYVWGGTNLQQRGKFVSDGNFDPNVMDTQLGAAAILKALCERSLAIDAEVNPPQSPVPPIVTPPVPSPHEEEIAHIGQLLSEASAKGEELMKMLKTARDVHEAIRSGKTAAELIDERKPVMANEIPDTAVVEVVPFYQKKSFWAMVLGTMVVPLVNQFTKGAFEISPWMQDWVATAIAAALGGGGVAAIINSHRITPTGAAKAKQ
jgi:lysozyme family protein